MDVEVSYKFDGDAKVSEVASFLRDKHDHGGGWSAAETSANKVGGFSSGDLRIDMDVDYDGGD